MTLENDDPENTIPCHWRGCDIKIARGKWACKNHWWALPEHLRTAIHNRYVVHENAEDFPSYEYLRILQIAYAWIAGYRAGQEDLSK